jgi:uncharacterized protein GlcG (DUF336 family)
MQISTAKESVERIRAEANKIGLPVSACVVDENGALVLFERMDNAIPISVDMAQRKAVTAALVGVSTGELATLTQPGQPLWGLTQANGGKYVALGGGVPVKRVGKVIGAVGVSGGSVEQDVMLATAGAKAGEAVLEHV